MNTRQFHSFFNLSQNLIPIFFCWFMCFLQVTKLKLFWKSKQKQFRVQDVYKACKEWWPNWKKMELFSIHLSVQNKVRNIKPWLMYFYRNWFFTAKKKDQLQLYVSITKSIFMANQNNFDFLFIKNKNRWTTVWPE